MGTFSRAEISAALQRYDARVGECSRTGDWQPFADSFTDDVEYIEHAYGTFRGRDAVREWIVQVMAPFPQMRIEQTWVAYDEPNDAVVFEVSNILDHPTEPGVEFAFPNLSRLVYAGDGLFCSQEDVYNPARDAPRVIRSWIEAGGTLRGPTLPMRHTP